MINKKPTNILWLLVAWSFFVSFGRSILPVHLAQEGLSYVEIIFGSSLIILGQLLVLFFMGLKKRVYRFQLMWLVAITLYSLLFILTGFKIISASQYYLGSLLAGIGSLLFYLFFNVSYFSKQKDSSVYSQSAKFFNTLGAMGIIVPFIAGVVGAISFSLVIVLAILFLFVVVRVIRTQDDGTYTFSFRESLLKARGARSIILLNGIFDSLGWGIISVFTLKFIQDAFSFGSFASYLAIVSILSNMLVTKLGDKYKKGNLIVVGSALLMSVSVFILGFSDTSLVAWAIATGFMNLVSPIFNSSVLALTLERSEDKILMLPAREILMNVGRLIGLVCAVIFIYIGSYSYLIFMLPSLAALLLGIKAFARKKA